MTINAVDSARPSISPTINALAPSEPTRNNGNRLWIISDETSINRLTKPSTQMAGGILVRVIDCGSDAIEQDTIDWAFG